MGGSANTKDKPSLSEWIEKGLPENENTRFFPLHKDVAANGFAQLRTSSREEKSLPTRRSETSSSSSCPAQGGKGCANARGQNRSKNVCKGLHQEAKILQLVLSLYIKQV